MYSPFHLVGLLALLLAAGSLALAGVTLIEAGKPAAKIYLAGEFVPAGAPQLADRAWVAAHAAAIERSEPVRDLVYHLALMSGATLQMVAADDPAQVKGPAIVLGELAVQLGAVSQRTSPSREGFRLLTRGDLVLIGGESDRAVGHGIYELLRTLGCDWVMPGKIGEIVPRRAAVTVPDLDLSRAPDFQMRNLWYRGYNDPRLPEEGARMAEWLRRQKGSGRETMALIGTAGHVWDAFIRRHQAEFDKDPTMYALVRMPDGSLKRSGPQLESTHPRVIQLFVEEIEKAYEENIKAGKWTRDTVAGFGIGPSDGLGYSISNESLAAGSGRIDPIVGEVDRTDELVLMGNRILAEVHKNYPNAYVGFYSYSTHADFPARYVPDPKIVIIFAPINFSRFNGVLDPNSKTQAYYRDVVQQWGRLAEKQGNVLIYRGYNWNLAENMLPYSKVKIWGEELPWYQRQHVVGLSVEATKAWSVNGASDYVFMRLAWDTSQRWQDLLQEYCRKSFGAGAKPMEAYLQRIIDRQQGSGQEAGSYHAFHLIFDDAFVKAGRRDIAEALRLAATPEDRERIGFYGADLEALRLYLEYFAATQRFDFPAVKADYAAMLAHWKKTYERNTDLVANETPAYLKRFIESFVEQGAKYSAAPYRLLVKIPDALATVFDPNDVGHMMNYQSPAINDSGFVKTKTISTTWDAQGLGGLRNGTVWYRFHFSLPADVRGKPVGLFLGGVEDEARVYLNGVGIGASGARFSIPCLFDLTDSVDYAKENVLAIQVVRNSKANEIGLGGLIRPSFIFTGPRLETKAPAPLVLRRVLPGGELGEEIK